jgi:hypothetical protein
MTGEQHFRVSTRVWVRRRGSVAGGLDPLQHHQANRQPVPAKALPGDLAVGDAISQRHAPDCRHDSFHVYQWLGAAGDAGR